MTPIAEHVGWITEGATALTRFGAGPAPRSRQSAVEGEWMRRRR